jgi:hypothetical protein
MLFNEEKNSAFLITLAISEIAMLQINSILIGFIGMDIPVLPTEQQNDAPTPAETFWQQTVSSAGYQLCLSTTDPTATELRLAVRRPDGSKATDAQVVVALIDQQHRHTLTRAESQHDGYRIDTRRLPQTLRRIEIEVVVDGRLLTDHFWFQSTTCNREIGHEYN